MGENSGGAKDCWVVMAEGKLVGGMLLLGLDGAGEETMGRWRRI